MFVTEKEAAEKWCPMVRIARRETFEPDSKGIAIVAGCNTDALGGLRVPASCRCIGSQCMMWTWLDNPDLKFIRLSKDQFATIEPERPSGVPATWEWSPYDRDDGPAGWMEPAEAAAARRRGVCGLKNQTA